MEGVGPGSTLTGRYLVGRRLEHHANAERWSAHDRELERDVCLLVLPSHDPRTATVLDAARMAAAIPHPVLVRILDIDSAGPTSYVVEESVQEATSLAELVRENTLPGDEVRRITGEVATALEAASTRGAHHLRLTADDVFRTPDGEIRVRGLGTDAALAGVEDGDEGAARTDAVSIVALAYAGLTGLAPLPGHEGSLPPAPVLPSGVAAPSDIAAGVPRDLDALTRLTLADGQGPTTPGDYARQVAPWSTRQIGGSTPQPPRARPILIEEAAGPVMEIANTPDAADSPDAADTSHTTSGEAEELVPARASDAEPVKVTPGPSGAGAGVLAAAAAGVGAVPAAAVPATAVPASAGVPVPVGVSAASAPPPSAPTPAQRATSFSSMTVNPPSGDDDAVEPPAPFLPAEPLPRSKTPLAMGMVLAFVLASLGVGLWGVSRIGSNTHLDFGSGVVATPSAQPSDSKGPAASELKKLGILSANGFDPQGDNSENDQLAPRVFDGNPQTAWTSEGYMTANLGGLKQGVGVILDLGSGVTPRKVDLVLQSQSDVSIYLSAQRSLDGARKVGEKAGANGTVSFTIDEPKQAQYLIVWFTLLSRDTDGFYRASLGEVTVYG